MNYKITVEAINKEGNIEGGKLEFNTKSHDNLFEIVEKLKQHPEFENVDVASLGVGLKLFTGVLLKNKEKAMFKNLMPHFKEFMKGLKSSGKTK
ncbi:protein of unknown function [Lutibacter oricola]|uniref:DUF3861 domain-containing protein n=1 Tax=Lutibacter oricola TaxID=762486 RepID=A0A1H2WVR0_9FLAO|nr:DUF3861 domain-containing protein [Lutibacter oricola]SDW84702.1 protein of unknown function [Lutibacter oricola]